MGRAGHCQVESQSLFGGGNSQADRKLRAPQIGCRTANSGGHRTKWRLASHKAVGAFGMRSAAMMSVTTVAPFLRRQVLANRPSVCAFDDRNGC